jgi:ABC-2 type transport system permease protein
MQLVLFPMLFLSGMMFPLTGLPRWLAVLTRLNPLTYAVQPLRQVVFAAQDMPLAARLRFPTGITIDGRVLPVAAELGVVAVFAVVFLVLAVRGLGRPE